MSLIRLCILCLCAFAFVALGASVGHATTQEVFVCKLNEGKTIDDFKMVAAEFKREIQNEQDLVSALREGAFEAVPWT